MKSKKKSTYEYDIIMHNPTFSNILSIEFYLRVYFENLYEYFDLLSLLLFYLTLLAFTNLSYFC